jgi:surface carbohydrate biosynthesis protein
VLADFLINYEHKAREIETICLIKAELERRGYSVEFSCTYDEDRIRGDQRQKAKVVLTSALYNDGCLYGFVYSIAGFCRKVVNLQWEQALTNQDESDPFFYQNPKGYSTDALHLCWGEEPRNRLLRAGVNGDRAVVVGPVQMDFLRAEFADFYFTREDLARRFDLDATKDWVLFISSFTFVNMTDEEYDTEVKHMGTRLHEFQRLSILSKQEIINWLEVAINRHPEKIFIYRPHPSESGDRTLLEMEAKHKNFRVVKDLSVKQWIKCSDKILTWYSTSAAEVYFSGKSCTILRPVAIPYEWDVSIYRNARMISENSHFLQDIEKGDDSFPLSESLLHDYFQVQDTTPAYMRLCDVLERVLNSHDYDMRKHKLLILIYIHLQRIRHRLFFILKEVLAGTNYRNLFMNNRFLIKKMEKHLAVMDRLRRDRGKNQASDKELTEVFSKIQRIVNAVEPG